MIFTSIIQTINSIKNNRTLLILLAQVFLAEVPRGIVLSSQPYYIDYLCHNITSSQMILGIAISAFSVGRLISAYPYGLMVSNTKSTRNTLLLASAISIIGCGLYVLASVLHSWAAIVTVILARGIIGFGSGTLGVSRAFMALISTTEQRTKFISWNTLLQYAGLSISPGLAELMIIITRQSNGRSLWAMAYLPTLIIAGLTLFLVGLLFLMPCQDPEPIEKNETVLHSQKLQSDDEKISNDVNDDETDANHESSSRSVTPESMVSRSDSGNEEHHVAFHVDSEKEALNNNKLKNESLKLTCAYILFLFLNFSLRGALSVVETFGGKQFEYLHPDEDLTNDTNEFFLSIGLIGLLTFFVIPRLEKLLYAYNSLILGIVFLSIGSILLLPQVTRDSIYVFGVGMVLIWSWSGPICQTLTISAYSQMLGSKPQAKAMSWLTTAGSIGRILFPLVAGVDITIAHSFDLGVSVVSILAIYAFAFKFNIPLWTKK